MDDDANKYRDLSSAYLCISTSSHAYGGLKFASRAVSLIEWRHHCAGSKGTSTFSLHDGWVSTLTAIQT